ncbi:MAG: H-NS family nucleoid-associated regulatory protein [Colwellia sp.]|jgi:hypothetical protein
MAITISDLDNQIKKLQEKKLKMKEKNRDIVVNEIVKLLKDNDYNIDDLLDSVIEKSKEEVKQVQLDNKIYKLPANGLGKRVKELLKAKGENPDTYTVEQAMKDYPVK